MNTRGRSIFLKRWGISMSKKQFHGANTYIYVKKYENTYVSRKN